MLILSRKSSESIVLGENKVVITVLPTKGSVARLGITSPSEVRVLRTQDCARGNLLDPGRDPGAFAELVDELEEVLLSPGDIEHLARDAAETACMPPLTRSRWRMVNVAGILSDELKLLGEGVALAAEASELQENLSRAVMAATVALEQGEVDARLGKTSACRVVAVFARILARSLSGKGHLQMLLLRVCARILAEVQLQLELPESAAEQFVLTAFSSRATEDAVEAMAAVLDAHTSQIEADSD